MGFQFFKLERLDHPFFTGVPIWRFEDSRLKSLQRNLCLAFIPENAKFRWDWRLEIVSVGLLYWMPVWVSVVCIFMCVCVSDWVFRSVSLCPCESMLQWLGLLTRVYRLLSVYISEYLCLAARTRNRRVKIKHFKLPDDGLDLFNGLTEKYLSFLGFTEQICIFLGSRRGVHARILGRNLTNLRILGWKNPLTLPQESNA